MCDGGTVFITENNNNNNKIRQESYEGHFKLYI